MVVTEEVKKRGRPKGYSPPSKKIKLKHNPKTALEDYIKSFGDEPLCVVYGLDEFTTNLINKLWNNPEITFHVTDPNESVLTNINRIYEQRSMSLYRWHSYSYNDFIAEPVSNTIVVSSKYIDEVRKLHNPENVKFIVLEEL